MSLYVNKVREFHSVFGHPFYDVPQENIFQDHPDRVTLRIALIKEEIGELIEAYEDSDFVEIADACADITYVIAGMALVFGHNLSHVDKTTASQMGGTFEKRTGNAKGLVYYPDCVEEGVQDRLGKKLKTIKLFFSELEKACTDKDFNRSMGALQILCCVVKEFSWSCNMDLDTIFNEVHRSNMTKVCATEEDAVESIKRITEEGRYKEPKYRKSDCGKYYVLYDDATQKILKNYKYEPPNIQPLLLKG